MEDAFTKKHSRKEMVSIDLALEKLGFSKNNIHMTSFIKRETSIPANINRKLIETNTTSIPNSHIRPRHLSVPSNHRNSLHDSKNLSAFTDFKPIPSLNSQVFRSNPRESRKPSEQRSMSNLVAIKKSELNNEGINRNQISKLRSISHLDNEQVRNRSITESTSSIPIESHKLNIDPNPILIRKKSTKKLSQVQNVSLKFLKPTEPPKPGEITIIQEPHVQIAPLPPKIVREKPPSPVTPPPIIFREKPPKIPENLPEKHLTIPGKILPPPPRRVIVEKLPKIPGPPPDLIIERWLGYKRRIRRVIFRAPSPITLLPNPKNLVIEWSPPECVINKKKINLGVEIADPREYEKKYGSNLVDSSQLPDVVNEIELRPPADWSLAANGDANKPPKLVGDIEPLRLLSKSSIDIRDFLDKLKIFTTELDNLNQQNNFKK